MASFHNHLEYVSFDLIKPAGTDNLLYIHVYHLCVRTMLNKAHPLMIASILLVSLSVFRKTQRSRHGLNSLYPGN